MPCKHLRTRGFDPVVKWMELTAITTAREDPRLKGMHATAARNALQSPYCRPTILPPTKGKVRPSPKPDPKPDPIPEPDPILVTAVLANSILVPAVLANSILVPISRDLQPRSY